MLPLISHLPAGKRSPYTRDEHSWIVADFDGPAIPDGIDKQRWKRSCHKEKCYR
jgi:hypothetical protein